jgi:dihydropyrimidinase
MLIPFPGRHYGNTMKTLIRNGTVVTATETRETDVLIEDESITQIRAGIQSEEATIIDATGKHLLPGGIDVHTHLELPIGDTVSSDDFYTGHVAAAFGGTTSHLNFAIQPKGGSLKDGLETWHAKAKGKACIDYGFHANITNPTEDTLQYLRRTLPILDPSPPATT